MSLDEARRRVRVRKRGEARPPAVDEFISLLCGAEAAEAAEADNIEAGDDADADADAEADDIDAVGVRALRIVRSPGLGCGLGVGLGVGVGEE